MNYNILIILMQFWAAVLGQYLRNVSDKSPIIGGELSPALPFLVQLEINCKTKVSSCGGTLITPFGAVTAAHCIYKCETAIAYFGTAEYHTGLIRKIKSWKCHPLYDSTYLTHDVGVVVWDEEIITPGIYPIRIGLHPIKGSKVQVAGFGLTKPEGEASKYLYAVTVGVEANEICKPDIVRKGFYELAPRDSFICTFDKPFKGACVGDSGGPMYVTTHETLLLGIVSFGAVPCYGGVDIYTSAFYFRVWIDKTIKCLRDGNSWNC